MKTIYMKNDLIASLQVPISGHARLKQKIFIVSATYAVVQLGTNSLRSKL